MPRLYILSGCNGAGKTTASYTVLPEQLNLDEYVNADEIAERLCPQDPKKEAIRASRIMMERIEELMSKGESFAVETTLATRAFARIIADAQKLGYTVTLFFFWLRSPQLAIERVARRYAAGGHTVPEDIITRRYEQGIDYLKKIYIPLCDFWVIVDNSETEVRKVASGGLTINTQIFDHQIYNHIMEMA